MSKTKKTPEKKRFYRGGFWTVVPRFARVAHRGIAAQTQSSLLGFRLVEVIDEQD